jgi:phosphoribosylamine-glycine ligase
MYTRLGSLFDDPPGDNLAVARKRAYAAADLISFNGMERREDIALRESVSSDHADP